jgi:hypothetical protein
MSLGMHRRSVNVKRTVLLEKLKENLIIHQKDFAEAVIGYKVKLLADLTTALAAVEKADPMALKNAKAVPFLFPMNQEKEYTEVIDMMEASVDETIGLDHESFRAYYKNEWAWSQGVATLNNSYKVFASNSPVGGAAGSV